MTVYLTSYLASVLTYFLAYILTLFLAFSLASIMTFYQDQAVFEASFLASILTFSLTFFLAFYTTFIHSLRGPSGSAHGDLELAVAVPQCPRKEEVTLIKARDLHLADGEKIGKTGKYKCCSFSLVSGLISLESPSASCPVVYPRRIKFLIFVVSSVNMFALEITKQKI